MSRATAAPWEDEKTLARFWSKVDRRGDDECWPWTGGAHPRGYGRFTLQHPRTVAAHRFAWEIANGREFPRGLNGCHRCDNPPCVNPAHIWPGTQAENLADMYAKGRRGRTTPLPAPPGPRSKPFCGRGHPMTPENARASRSGGRRCATCMAIYQREWNARRRASAGGPPSLSAPGGAGGGLVGSHPASSSRFSLHGKDHL